MRSRYKQLASSRALETENLNTENTEKNKVTEKAK